jgi:hypothetical protein
MSIHSRLNEGEKLVVSPRHAKHMLDVGNTRLYELLNRKELDSFLDGRSRKITVESIYRFIARRLALTRDTSNVLPRRRSRPPKTPIKAHSPVVS